MALFTFNQANGTLLSAISATWAGDVSSLEVQSSKLEASGGGIFALKTAYLNESGSTYAVAKFKAGSLNEYRVIVCSSDGTIANGYYLSILGTTCSWVRNGVFQLSYTIPGSHNASTTDTEVKLEKAGSVINLYVGPIGSPVLVDNPTDGSPISGGFSGFWFNSGGTTTGGVISFDNGVVPYTYARPASDITKQWTPSTGSDHYAMIDEVTASDADYISATAAGQTTEVKLQAMTAPQAGTSVAIGYRVQGITGTAGVTVSMVQGTTVIATDTTRTANGDYTLTVASGTWASVTDWTDIRLRFVST
jgi:hypothetical protein